MDIEQGDEMKSASIKFYGKPLKGTPQQMRRAIKIEKEHTKSTKVAKAIVNAHLKEFGWKYYNKKYGLPAMERRLSRMKR